jgi:hypothetical protein
MHDNNRFTISEKRKREVVCGHLVILGSKDARSFFLANIIVLKLMLSWLNPVYIGNDVTNQKYCHINKYRKGV